MLFLLLESGYQEHMRFLWDIGACSCWPPLMFILSLLFLPGHCPSTHQSFSTHPNAQHTAPWANLAYWKWNFFLFKMGIYLWCLQVNRFSGRSSKCHSLGEREEREPGGQISRWRRWAVGVCSPGSSEPHPMKKQALTLLSPCPCCGNRGHKLVSLPLSWEWKR